jgi:hypothetical protein
MIILKNPDFFDDFPSPLARSTRSRLSAAIAPIKSQPANRPPPGFFPFFAGNAVFFTSSVRRFAGFSFAAVSAAAVAKTLMSDDFFRRRAYGFELFRYVTGDAEGRSPGDVLHLTGPVFPGYRLFFFHG